MVSAYMYPAGAPGAQAAPQAQAGPTASPAYSSYQPTPTPGYQVGDKTAPLPAGPGPAHSPLHHFLPQNVASQAPQSLPAIAQPPQPGTMGYMGSPSVSMGYQPYNMQVWALGRTLPVLGFGVPQAEKPDVWAQGYL